MRKRSIQVISACLLVLTGLALTVAVRPRGHGLLVTRYMGHGFDRPLAPPELDQQIYLETGQPRHQPPKWLQPHMSVRWEGYVEAPREGEYRFNLITDDSGWLYIDEKNVLDNGGIHPARGVDKALWLSKGLHRIRIDYYQEDGGAVMKLEWRLPSGYNTLGLLPVTFFHPTEISLPNARTYAFRVFPLALLLLGGLLFMLPILSRWLGALSSDPRRRRQLVWGLLVTGAALSVRLFQLNASGETCDEWAYVGGGRIYIENIVGGVFDSDQWRINREHPAVGKLLYGAAQYFFGDQLAVSRTVSALLNTATVLLAYLAAVRWFGLATGVFAALLLAVFPSFVAHGKIAALDCPAGFFFTLAMYLFFVGLEPGPKQTRRFGWLAVAIGLGIATKFSVGLVLLFVLTAYPLIHWKEILHTGRLSLPWTLYLLPALAFIPLVALWPWLWQDTSAHFKETLGHWNGEPWELYFGRTQIVPIYYFFVCFAAVTPVALLLPWGVALIQVIRPKPASLTDPVADVGGLSIRLRWLLTIAWFLLPFVWSFAGYRQDGIRYVYPAFVPFAMLVGAGLVILGRSLEQGVGRLSRVFLGLPWGWCLGAAAIVYVGVASARVHPYYLDYYNEIIGGASGAYTNRRLETGWWGEGTDRAIDYLNVHAPQGATVGFRGLVDHVVIGLRSDLRRQQSSPDFFISTDFSPGAERPAGYEEAYTLRSGQAPLAGVFQKEARKPEALKSRSLPNEKLRLSMP
jgi:hypothetical protein